MNWNGLTVKGRQAAGGPRSKRPAGGAVVKAGGAGKREIRVENSAAMNPGADEGRARSSIGAGACRAAGMAGARQQSSDGFFGTRQEQAQQARGARSAANSAQPSPKEQRISAHSASRKSLRIIRLRIAPVVAAVKDPTACPFWAA